MKIFAYHLPQFHETSENNKWWGKGFTEWTNTRSAKKNFPFQRQPRIPLLGEYDLSKIDDIENQVSLAKEYGIDGFCFYHYYFEDGNTMLTKPLELLQSSTINFNYFFCWANEPWTKSWEGKPNEILMPQSYGGKKYWENHIKYLLKYFNDDRYLKINNKPVFFIHKSDLISDLEEMISYFNNRLIEEGYNGIHFVSCVRSQSSNKVSEDSSNFEPFYSINSFSNRKLAKSLLPIKLKRILLKINDVVFSKLKSNVFDYDTVWIKLLKNMGLNSKYPCAFVDWDNTPRRKTEATIFRGFTPEKFEYYFDKLYSMALEKDSEFLLINAWNEWAEGTYLEPDTDNEYKILNSVKKVKQKYETSCE